LLEERRDGRSASTKTEGVGSPFLLMVDVNGGKLNSTGERA